MKNSNPNPPGLLAGSNFRVHIGELILHGIAPGDRYRVGEAVERELARLFLESGIPPTLTAGHDVEHLNAGTFKTAARPAPVTFGAQVANAVYQQLAVAPSALSHPGGKS
jgi:hypothetical protein